MVLFEYRKFVLTETPEHIIKYNNVHYSKKNSTVTLHLSSYKHSVNAADIVITCTPIMAKILSEYLVLRGNHRGPFFCSVNHSPFSRNTFVSFMKELLDDLKLNPQHYNSHSFRIGKATDMAQQGFSEIEICTLGRWKSDAYKAYLKPEFIYSNNGAH